MSKKVTLKQASEMGFGSRSTLMRRIRFGELPSEMDGKRRVVDLDDLKVMYDKRHPSVVDSEKAFQHIVKTVCAQAPEMTDEQRMTIINILRSSR